MQQSKQRLRLARCSLASSDDRRLPAELTVGQQYGGLLCRGAAMTEPMDQQTLLTRERGTESAAPPQWPALVKAEQASRWQKRLAALAAIAALGLGGWFGPWGAGWNLLGTCGVVLVGGWLLVRRTRSYICFSTFSAQEASCGSRPATHLYTQQSSAQATCCWAQARSSRCIWTTAACGRRRGRCKQRARPSRGRSRRCGTRRTSALLRRAMRAW